MTAKTIAATLAFLIVATLGVTAGAANAATYGSPAIKRTHYPAARHPTLFEVYTWLKGSREFCYLPSEPCNNNHRVQN
jgi:hypothetical protein